MGITGITDNKLFKVRSYDTINPYKVGVNGVTNIDVENVGLVNYDVIEYVIDGITYKTYLNQNNRDIFSTNNTKTSLQVKITDNFSFKNVGSNDTNSLELLSLDRTSNVKTLRTSRRSNKFFLKTPRSIDNVKSLSLTSKDKNSENSIFTDGDTIFETDRMGYDDYVKKNIFKKEDYVGLIDVPVIKAEIFIERDSFAIMERHQRISEINSLFELEIYKDGYYKNVNTI
jgi:hypothetical protein